MTEDNRIREIRAELASWYPDGPPVPREVLNRIRAILDSAPPAPRETIHRCPADGMLFTPCCATAPFELPATDRLTADPALVTCRAGERANPEPEGTQHG